MTLSGKRMAGGGCSFSSAENTESLSSLSGYSEETAFNPSTCQETLVAGSLTPTQAASLNSSGAVQQPNAPAPPSKSTSKGTQVQPAAAGTLYEAFEKASWVDPVDLTITSVTTNLDFAGNGVPASQGGVMWAAGGYASTYQFPYDNWSSSGVSYNWYGCLEACSYVALQSSDTFYNTDFELVVVAIFGLTGYAACGFDSSPATFYLSPYTFGYPNAYYGWGNYNSVSGGCSDLVHFRENHGSGHSS